MLTRDLKLKPNKIQEQILNDYLYHLSSIYNWALRKIELNAKNKIYFSKLDFQNFLSDHSKKLNIPSHTIQSVLLQAYNSWNRCFKKISKKPKLKSVRNKLKSISFPDPIPLSRISRNKIGIPGLGRLKYHKQDLPKGKIKNARIVKKSSGWFCVLTLDAIHKFPIKETTKQVGIDTGFKHLAVLSDGVKFENPRNFIQGQKRLAQAQRGNRKKLASRLQERIKNRRKDYNHKVSRKIVENYKEIYITNDNLKGQAKTFGKSVSDAGISQLRTVLSYKSGNHCRKFSLVDSFKTTMTCSNCWSLTGPKGLNGLAVRVWECSDCGSVHDRDINSAKVILKLGLGTNLEGQEFHDLKSWEVQ